MCGRDGRSTDDGCVRGDGHGTTQPCAPARGAANPADSRPPGPTRGAPTVPVDTDGRTQDGRARPSRAPRRQERGSDVTRGRVRASYWPSRAPAGTIRPGGAGRGRASAPGLAQRARARTGSAGPPTTTAAAGGLPLVRLVRPRRGTLQGGTRAPPHPSCRAAVSEGGRRRRSRAHKGWPGAASGGGFVASPRTVAETHGRRHAR